MSRLIFLKKIWADFFSETPIQRKSGLVEKTKKEWRIIFELVCLEELNNET